MNYATINKSGEFSGTVYSELTQAVRDWHTESGLTFIEIAQSGLDNAGTVENPNYGSPAPDQLAAQEAKAVRAGAMLEGFNYKGYQVSVTEMDGSGVTQVKGAFDLGLMETVLHFKNGTEMTVTAADFNDFARVFVTERNKFFM